MPYCSFDYKTRSPENRDCGCPNPKRAQMPEPKTGANARTQNRRKTTYGQTYVSAQPQNPKQGVKRIEKRTNEGQKEPKLRLIAADMVGM